MLEPMPRLLYKYLPPERLDVLTGGSIRISQRQAVNDPDDFIPPAQALAPREELERVFSEQIDKDRQVPEPLRPAVIEHVLDNYQPRILDLARSFMRTPDELGMICLSDSAVSARMWEDYACEGTGFVIGFDSAKFAGTTPAHLMVRRVVYRDEPLTYLADGIANLAAFFQKGTQWGYESEWRALGRLDRFPSVGTDLHDLPVHLFPFPGTSVAGVVIRPNCTIEAELSHLIAVDARYRHVQIAQLP